MTGQQVRSGPRLGTAEARRALSCNLAPPSSPSGLLAASSRRLHLPAREERKVRSLESALY